METTIDNTVSRVQSTVSIPEGNVSFRNLRVDAKKRTFSIEYAYLEGRKRKFSYEKASGTLTPEMYDWFCKSFQPKESIGNEMVTPFKLWLERKGMKFVPGILRSLDWECNNRSTEFDDCPFTLTVSDSRRALLHLVYKFDKVLLSTTEDPNTGKVTQRFGYAKYENKSKKFFVRLRIFKTID